MNIQRAASLALNWIDKHSCGGVQASSRIEKTYPEVTGYLIPTLYRFDWQKRANKFADYLFSTQNESGSWNGLDGEERVFDTAAVMEGIRHVHDDRSLSAYKRAEQWILDNCVHNGHLTIAPHNTNSEIYLARAAGIIDPQNKRNLFNHWLEWAPTKSHRSHYIAYMVEGYCHYDIKMAIKLFSMFSYTKPQPFLYHPDGNMTGACYPATAQFAMLNARFGMYGHAKRLINHLIDKQNPDGSIGPDGESWTLKFFLDAIHLCLK